MRSLRQPPPRLLCHPYYIDAARDLQNPIRTESAQDQPTNCCHGSPSLTPQALLWLTSGWFLLTYVGLALGNLPGLRMDRAGIALVGATLMMVCGALTFDEAARAVDYATIALLFGMMVVVAFLRLAGFFERLARFALSRVRTPRGLLAMTIGLSGLLSAFLVNDIV